MEDGKVVAGFRTGPCGLQLDAPRKYAIGNRVAVISLFATCFHAPACFSVDGCAILVSLLGTGFGGCEEVGKVFQNGEFFGWEVAAGF
jgi:hypothetical protein